VRALAAVVREPSEELGEVSVRAVGLEADRVAAFEGLVAALKALQRDRLGSGVSRRARRLAYLLVVVVVA
jgi:hypothetical protein